MGTMAALAYTGLDYNRGEKDGPEQKRVNSSFVGIAQSREIKEQLVKRQEEEERKNVFFFCFCVVAFLFCL